MKQLFFEEVAVDTEIPASFDEINLLRLLRYAAATWNFFLIHLDKEFAQKQGIRDVNIPAPLYGAFLAKMVTNWIGSQRRLKKLGYSVRVMGYPGDTLICKGKVVRKYQEAGENLVDCDIWVENQEGVKVAPASATVSLPAKGV